LLGRSQPGEEPELVVVALCLAPLTVDCRNQGFGFLNAERIDASDRVLRPRFTSLLKKEGG
jgi:hypothetical protein